MHVCLSLSLVPSATLILSCLVSPAPAAGSYGMLYLKKEANGVVLQYKTQTCKVDVAHAILAGKHWVYIIDCIIFPVLTA
jgi:hypothetical protein